MFKSPKQKQVYKIIVSFSEKNGYFPSYEEIAKKIKVKSVSTVFYHIQTLIKDGIIEKKWNSRREIKLIK